DRRRRARDAHRRRAPALRPADRRRPDPRAGRPPAGARARAGAVLVLRRDRRDLRQQLGPHGVRDEHRDPAAHVPRRRLLLGRRAALAVARAQPPEPDLLPAERRALRLPRDERRQRRAVARGHGSARRGRRSLERVAVSDGAPAEAVGDAPGGRGIAWLDPVPPVALVIAAALSVQFGAAFGATIFDAVGPGGASLLRQVFAAVILLAGWRPRLGRYTAADLRLAGAFGVALGLMNLFFYEALDRIPLGICVTIEFIGPVAVAVAFSRRALDLLWIALAVCGIVLLANPFGAGGVD